MLSFDYTNVRQEIIGLENGLDIDFEFSNYSQKISDIITNIYKQEENYTTNYPWISDYQNHIFLDKIQEYADSVKGQFENIIVIGLGSPIFGIKAIAEALLLQYWNTMNLEERNGYPLLHFVTNIDADNINRLLSVKKLKKSLIIINSRNGLEPEIMSLFMIIKNILEKERDIDYKKHIIACTVEGSLFHKIANEEGYKCFKIPQENTGSFSILTSYGILPLILTGINVKEILTGLKDIINYSSNTDIKTNQVAKTALIHYLLFVQKQKNISVLMSYSTRLKNLPSWCSQFKSESLSKDYDNSGRFISAGQIPYNAYGCNDQHALLQSFIEGSNNKIINIIKVKNFETDNTIPNIFDYTPIGYLGGKTLTELMNAEIEALKMVLTDNQRPNITLTIPQISPYYMGQFVGMYMLNIAIQAALYNINPYSFAGAENFQNYVCAQMGQFGYEETLREMHEKLENIKKQLVLPE